MRKPEMSGRMAKWSVQLSTYELHYEPRTAIKSQALADFVADFSPSMQPEVELEVQQLEDSRTDRFWTLHTDGASNAKGTGVGFVLKSPQGDIIPQAVCCDFDATNNEAEYEAMIMGLNAALALNIKCLHVYSDSLLIVNHFSGEYATKTVKMAAYLQEVRKLAEQFDKFTLEQVPREQNVEADALANLGSTCKSMLNSNIPIIYVKYPAIEQPDLDSVNTNHAGTSSSTGATLDAGASWMDPIRAYIQNGTVPHGEKNARAFRIRNAHYTLIDNVLFKKSRAGPYLRCLDADQAAEVLFELHAGECGNHAGGKSLSRKALRMGYYWPTMNQDAAEFSKKCDACQRHSNILASACRASSPHHSFLAIHAVGDGYCR